MPTRRKRDPIQTAPIDPGGERPSTVAPLWRYLADVEAAALVCDEHAEVQWSSPSVHEVLGVRPDELHGLPLTDLFAETAQPHIADRVRLAQQGSTQRTPISASLAIDHAGAASFDVDIVAFPTDGRRLLLVTLRDASSRLAAGRALAESETRFRNVVNNVPYGIGIEDQDGNFVFLNARFKEMLGVQANYILRDEVADLMDLAEVNDRRGGLQRDDEPIDDITVRFTPEGETRFGLVTLLPQEGAGGESSTFWAVADVTARVRAEQDQARLHRLMETSSDLVLVMTHRSVPLYANRAARNFFGIPLDATLDGEAEAIEFGTVGAAQVEEIAESLRDGRIWEGELLLLGYDGLEPFSATLVPDTSGHRVLRYSAVLRNIGERKAFEQRLEWEARHDPLTQLANRLLLGERLDRALATAGPDQHVAVVFLDLDNFRMINESLGHRRGDRLLLQTARTLEELVGNEGVVARFGADEFVVMVDRVRSEESAAELAEGLRQAVSGRVELPEVDLLMSCTAGVAISDGADVDSASIIRDANAAVHEAKLRGRDRTEVFSSAVRQRALDRVTVESGLRGALRSSEFRLFYQPKVDLDSGRLAGAEALIRWQQPGGPLVGPDEFVPIAESSGLIVPIGEWVIREACSTLRSWTEQLGDDRPLHMAINLSGRQLARPTIATELRSLLEESGVDPTVIEFEITESVLLDDVERSIRNLGQIKDLGVRLALDDFGTGYSSLTYLRRYPIDVIKIDRSFVSGIGSDPENAAIVRSVVELAQALGLSCVAEGVETAGDLAAIRALGCDVAQGYLIAKPLSDGDAMRLLGYDPRY
ncbi:MAG: EAL domain-containing protein [Microthrixaceae bacterium]